VIDQGGYAGHSVCTEIGYATALGKAVILSEPPAEDAVLALASEVIPVADIAKRITHGHPGRGELRKAGRGRWTPGRRLAPFGRTGARRPPPSPAGKPGPSGHILTRRQRKRALGRRDDPFGIRVLILRFRTKRL
jgi:hypothetical protein